VVRYAHMLPPQRRAERQLLFEMEVTIFPSQARKHLLLFSDCIAYYHVRTPLFRLPLLMDHDSHRTHPLSAASDVDSSTRMCNETTRKISVFERISINHLFRFPVRASVEGGSMTSSRGPQHFFAVDKPGPETERKYRGNTFTTSPTTRWKFGCRTAEDAGASPQALLVTVSFVATTCVLIMLLVLV